MSHLDCLSFAGPRFWHGGIILQTGDSYGYAQMLSPYDRVCRADGPDLRAVCRHSAQPVYDSARSFSGDSRGTARLIVVHHPDHDDETGCEPEAEPL